MRRWSFPLLAILAGLLFQDVAGSAERQATPRFDAHVIKVIDGDTFDLGDGRRIRLQGISAPEWNERGGPAATAALKGMIEGRRIRCEDSGERSHRRVVARCYIAGEDVGRALIREGLARDCPRHSGGRYANDETAAGRTLYLPPYCRAD